MIPRVLFSGPHVTYDSAMPIGNSNDHRLVLGLRIDYKYYHNMNDAVN